MNAILKRAPFGIGSCVFCIRRSFQYAIVAWLFTLLAIPVDRAPITGLFFVISVALSVLWSLHLLVYSGRNVLDRATEKAGPESAIFSFFKSLVFIASESTMLFDSPLKDRFGRVVGKRAILVEFKNLDGSRTAYYKTNDDVDALINALSLRGVEGQLLSKEYWMSTDSCERSSGTSCSDNNCDDDDKDCKQRGVGMTYCRCV